MPTQISDLIQGYIDWLNTPLSGHHSPMLLGTLVIHNGTSPSKVPEPDYGIDTADYDQVFVARGIARNGQDGQSIVGEGWKAHVGTKSFALSERLTFDVTISKSGLMTTWQKIDGKPVGGMPPFQRTLSVDSTGLVMTSISEIQTVTLSLKKANYGWIA